MVNYILIVVIDIEKEKQAEYDCSVSKMYQFSGNFHVRNKLVVRKMPCFCGYNFRCSENEDQMLNFKKIWKPLFGEINEIHKGNTMGL